MARIRTVKPELLRHTDLYQLEKETGLPIRIAWVGLFTCCDREGRFSWSPEALKLDCLPYDDVDFSRVLDAWWTRGFIVKYAWRSGGKERVLGAIPTWLAHQVINHREKASVFPHFEDDDCIIIYKNDNLLTRAPRVKHASTFSGNIARGEGKGREGKGREGNTSCGTREKLILDSFEELWKRYPKKIEKTQAQARFIRLIKSIEDIGLINKALDNYLAKIKTDDTEVKFIKNFATFLGNEKTPDWRDWVDYSPSDVVFKKPKFRREGDSVPDKFDFSKAVWFDIPPEDQPVEVSQ